jgi:hypothetical protein
MLWEAGDERMVRDRPIPPKEALLQWRRDAGCDAEIGQRVPKLLDSLPDAVLELGHEFLSADLAIAGPADGATEVRPVHDRSHQGVTCCALSGQSWPVSPE